MDHIDLKIQQILLGNSRVTYRDLAERIDISVSAVHKRIKKMEEDKILITYNARPSIIALNYLAVLIFGASNAKSIDTVCEELGQHQSIISITIASGKFLYISAYLKSISELQEYSSYVSRLAQINDPTVAIANGPYDSLPESLTNIDYKILKSLNRDARKPLIDIAEEVGLSAKTVKKRLDRMVEANLAMFSIEFVPLDKDSFVTIFHLEVEVGTDINSTVNNLYNKYPHNIVVCTGFSNLPNFILLETWTQTARETQLIQEELQAEGFKDVTPHIFLSISWYQCWLDQYLQIK
jgi:Lrp/AsnC family leucine-responsive transcriptional regulator